MLFSWNMSLSQSDEAGYSIKIVLIQYIEHNKLNGHFPVGLSNTLQLWSDKYGFYWTLLRLISHNEISIHCKAIYVVLGDTDFIITLRPEQYGWHLHATFSSAFPGMKCTVFWLTFHLILFLIVQLTTHKHWFTLWCDAVRQQAITWTLVDQDQ